MIFYNKPYITGNEFHYIESAIANRHLSGNGKYTNLCQQLINKKYGFKKSLLTTSCTDALEMCALLLEIQPGDEVIIPSYTFVSSANAFILRGAKIVFADSYFSNPNIDEAQLEKLITVKTKAIVIVHYAGIACNMQTIMSIANKNNLFVVEDAAQAIDGYFINSLKEKIPLGSIGHLAAFSFHESKNIQCGEGGLLVINDEKFFKRAEILWEKGTNRAAFFRGEVDKYNWVDVGSSFLPSEITAAFLYAQLLELDKIQEIRKHKWQLYYNQLIQLEKEGKINLPAVPQYATVNAHIFYLVCSNLIQREKLINYLKENGVQAIFHYLGLHSSPFFLKTNSDSDQIINAKKFSDCLLRLPLYVELSDEKINYISRLVINFFNNPEYK